MSTERGDVRPPSGNADEKTTPVTFLAYLREAIAAKVQGVSDEAARFAGVPSGTSLLRLLKHLIAVEHNWFVWAYHGDGSLMDDNAFPAGTDTAASLLTEYRETIRRCDRIIATCHDLDRPGARPLRETEPPSMRWLLVHMIGETARHAGHADILREQIDGSTGR
ncbi:DinB family protein [Amycolatopsis endophytica]|uniref:Putative damage-inducible protein DinB n=1 Tax=Amycolatopsis endophytica TaxID=860233 RepID=A0A853AVU0_9PSEU|nr:DinB family protein [Amycolatopsis endophytica]NYI86744.1 putative damage-inducible protein DinB [Amycolatopsis endophytica]